MIDKQRIAELSTEILQEVIDSRRHLHRFPELSFQEVQTSAFIAGKLREWGIPFQENIGGYGVVGMIEGEYGAGPTIALRGDMDALPIQEENDVEYASVHDGVMHACGHDVHSSSLLGTAFVLSRMKANFAGRVKLVFQPGEEKLPGGASLMIRDGFFGTRKRLPSSVSKYILRLEPAWWVFVRENTWLPAMNFF